MRHAGLSDLRSWRLRSEGRQMECSFFSLFRIAHFSSWRAVEKPCIINLSPESQWISRKHHTWPSVCRAETWCSQQGGMNSWVGVYLKPGRDIGVLKIYKFTIYKPIFKTVAPNICKQKKSYLVSWFFKSGKFIWREKKICLFPHIMCV